MIAAPRLASAETRTPAQLSEAFATTLSAGKIELQPRTEELAGAIADLFRLRRIELPDYDARGAIISLFASDHREKFTGISRYRLYDLMHKMYCDPNKRGSYDLTSDEPCPCVSIQRTELIRYMRQ